MRARTLLYILAACSPAVLLCLLGISGRFLVLEWDPPEYGPRVSQEILSYRLPVMLETALWEKNSQPSKELTMAVVEIWISAYDQGIISDFEPAAVSDIGNNGVRQEIISSRDRLIEELYTIAQSAKRDGDAELLEKTTASSLRLAKILKYTSPVIAFRSANYQMRSLEIYKDLQPNQVSSGISESLLFNNAEFSDTTLRSRFDKLSALAKLERHSQQFQVLAQISFEDAISMKGQNLVRLAGRDMDQVSVIYAFRQAYTQDQRLAQMLTPAIEELNVEKFNQSESRIRLSVQSESNPTQLTKKANSAGLQLQKSSTQSPLPYPLPGQ